MYYQQLLSLLDKSHTFADEIQAVLQQNGSSGVNGKEGILPNPTLDGVITHYNKYHLVPMIVETDRTGIVTYVNAEFARHAKYEPKELIGQNINILRSSSMESGMFRDLWNHLLEGKSWSGQIQNRAQDYSSYWVDTYIAPVFDSDGSIQKYWSLSFDITHQKEQQLEIEAKSKDVHESLKYAKRIQQTILPSNKDLDEEFEDYFILYRPKDVVSGDFYWFARTINRIYIAVVDCTGHGVPGAFMSLIGYNLLNQIVLQQNITNPGAILSELHRQIRNTLRQDDSDSKSKDGMDVCLCAIDRYGEELQYAGAFRPLFWMHRGQLEVINGDKMSIGGEQLEEERIFTNHLIELDSEDVIYMFSDGIIDQFGGPDLKKFSTKKLKQIIEENHHESMKVQKALFNLVWKEWKGDGEQTDDVTMIGIRFNF